MRLTDPSSRQDCWKPVGQVYLSLSGCLLGSSYTSAAKAVRGFFFLPYILLTDLSQHRLLLEELFSASNFYKFSYAELSDPSSKI